MFAGVAENRLQNIVITLDKVKRFLRQPGQPLGPPLQLLSDDEVSQMIEAVAQAMLLPRRFALPITAAHKGPMPHTLVIHSTQLL